MDYKQEQFMRMQQYQYAPKMPFYMSYPVQNLYMAELEYERDMERMKDLYPDEAKRIQSLVEEECDKMEYEGSLMFDEYPDRVMLRVICDRIYQNVTQPQKGKMSELERNTRRAEELETQQAGQIEGQQIEGQQIEGQQFWQGPGRPPGPPGPPPPPFGPPGPPPFRPPGNQGLNNLIEVLLYNEMYKRRCRHHRCRRWW